MKRLATRLALAAAFLSLVPVIALAADPSPFYVGVTGGLVMPRDLHEDWNNVYPPYQNQTADLTYAMCNGWLVGFKAGYTPTALNGVFSVELEYSYQQADMKTLMTPGFTAFTTTLPAFFRKMNDSSETFHSVSLNLLVRYPEGRIHPYLGIGPGVTRSSVSFNEPGLFMESGHNTGFSYQILAGVDVDVSSRVSLGGGYRYFVANPTIRWANGTHSHYDPRLNNFVFEVKFRF